MNAYVDVLKPVTEMVIDLQAEKEPTSNKILGHAVSIWLHLRNSMTLSDRSSLYQISLASAALEAFNPPGLNYDMIKKTVIDEVRFLTPDDFVRCSTPSRSAKFAQSGHNVIEKEMNSYAALLSIGENPLDFWRNNEKYFPYLVTLARLVLSVPASSSPSERAFKELRCIMIDFTRNKMSAKKIASLIHMRTSFLNNL
uniref:HAT C-terminal dimerisation domain-containing protein n=1 Tax=Ditylenchus dipsaci TaxID=166011 RepID=A0A915E6P8_9BILA